MVPSVRVLYLYGVIQFQQEYSPFTILVLFKNCYLGLADIELIDWPPRSPDMNPIENMWTEVKNPCRKPGLTALREKVMIFGPLCQTLGMKSLHLNVMCNL
jgi:hypothetical protein